MTYQYKKLATHPDERGFFREIIRHTDDIFKDGSFAQLSHSVKHEGYYTAEFHFHRHQTDWWYVPIGTMRVVLCELDYTMQGSTGVGVFPKRTGNYIELISNSELVIRIPPMTAHGFKVLNGPVHLLYMTDQVYNPEDEGRIELDYNWLK